MSCVQSGHVRSLGPVLLLQRLKGAVMKLNQSSAESSLKKIIDYLHRPLSAFNKYKALKMMDSLQHLAKGTKHERPSFYCLVYQTIPQKIQGKP